MSRAPKSLLSNTVASGAAIGWTALVTLGLTPFLIRQLGVMAYGVWVTTGPVLLIQGRGLASSPTWACSSRSSSVVAAAEDGRRCQAAPLGTALRILTVMAVVSAAAVVASAPLLAGLFQAFLPVLEGDAVRGLRLLGLETWWSTSGVELRRALEGLRRYEVTSGYRCGPDHSVSALLPSPPPPPDGA